MVLEQLCTSINSQKAQRTELLLLATFHVVGPSEERETVRAQRILSQSFQIVVWSMGFPKDPAITYLVLVDFPFFQLVQTFHLHRWWLSPVAT